MQRGRGYYPNANPRNFNRRGRESREHIVEDLREKLNRMKLEKEKAHDNEGVKNPPPPDPAYNFLKDPLRGDNCAHSSNEKKVGNKDWINKSETKVESKETDNDQKNSAETNEKDPQKQQRAVRFVEDVKTPSPRRGPPRPNWKTPYYEKRFNNFTEKVSTPKQQSVDNIKVEISSESGERKCTFDNSKTVEVPIMPKQNYTVTPKTGRWSYRGPQRYYGGRYNNKPRTGFQANSDRNIQETNKRDNRRNFKNKRINQNENQSEIEEANGNNVKKQVNEKEVQPDKKEYEAKTETKVNLETKAEAPPAKET